jgi:glycerophosphoryl diester phosphodiesterase
LGILGIGAYSILKRRSHPVPNHPYLVKQGILAMAHRGGMGLWPPNTLYAFERASALGVDALEMDIHATKDGVIVVRHDPTVDQTTDGTGYIQNLTLAELKRLDAGYNWTSDGGLSYPFRGLGITVPTLEEVISALPNMRLNIDIKPEDPAAVAPFCQILRRYSKLNGVMVGSFHNHQLRRFRELCPEVATAAGVSETELFYGLTLMSLSGIFQPRANAFQIPEYQGSLHVVTERFVKNAHAHNMEVHVWTVNEVDDMRRLLDWGVDGLISDYPDRLMSLLGR